MPSTLSLDIARQLRPNRPFHLPPDAQPINASVTLTLEGVAARPVVWITDTRRDFTWDIVLSPAADQPNTWQTTLKLPMKPTILTYFFEADGALIHEYHQIDSRDTNVGNRPVYGEWEERPYKIAVYDPARMPAQWTHGMVVYQIFPDRFAKAQDDAAVQAALRGVYGHEPKFMPWGALPENPPLGRDFFGGDLRGLTEKLDYLYDLGVECIYLNPIFTASSNHRYEAINFMEIDPMLGTEADFDTFLMQAHLRGMTVMLDAVFNHCSSDSIYFDITGKFGNGASQSQESPYYRWFKFTDWPKQYDGWIGLGFMPEFVECPEMEDYFLGESGVTAHWLRKGIDGWRADVANDNTHEFWQRFRDRVDQTKPEAWLISEEWRDATRYLLGDTFSGTMNYRFTWAVRGFLAKDAINASELDDRLQTWLRDTPEPAQSAQMNLLDSHDTDRMLTACGGDRRRLMQAVAFLFAYVGAPTIFYGDETGLEGAFSEDSRRTMPWDGLDEELGTFFRRVMQYRKNSSVLRFGQTETVLADDTRRLYGFLRHSTDSALYAVFNASDTDAEIALPLRAEDRASQWHDVLRMNPVLTAADGMLHFTLPARGAVWYTSL